MFGYVTDYLISFYFKFFIFRGYRALFLGVGTDKVKAKRQKTDYRPNVCQET